VKEGDAETDSPVAPRLRLRYGPAGPHRAWLPIQPINRTQLLAEGRIDRLQFAPRLERVPDPPERPAPSLKPVGAIPRWDLLTPLTRPVALTAPGLYWTLPRGRSVHLGPHAGAATLLYLGNGRSAAGVATIALDGKRPAPERLFTARGKLRLPIQGGEHRLRVDAPSPVALFVNRPVESAAPLRFVSVYPFDRRRGLRLRVAKKSAARSTVGVVLYGRGPVPKDAQLHCTIDGGQRRRRAQVSHDRTILDRRLPIHALAAGGMRALNVADDPTWTSEPIFIALGDDLAPGPHRLSLSGLESPLVFGRFFLLSSGRASGVDHGALAHAEITP
jgi:hypothetical protein